MMKGLTTMLTTQISTRVKSSLAILGCLAVLAGIVPASIYAQGSRYALTFQNNSRFRIDRIYVSTSDEENWGPDQLEERVLKSGSQFKLTNIKAGEYDVKIIDVDGDSCVIRRVNLFTNTTWSLTTDYMLRCEGFRR